MTSAYRGPVILSVLLAASLLWAYLVTHPPGGAPPAAGAPVTVWSVAPEDVRHVVYQDGAYRVEVSPDWSRGPAAPYLWIVEHRPAPAARPAKPGHKPLPTPKAEERAFKGNPAALAAVRYYAKPSARRALGPLAKLDGKAFGLPDSEHFIELQRSGGKPPLRLELGRSTVGGAERYAYTPGDGRVYLLRTADVERLAQAGVRLMDRRVVALSLAQVTRVALSTNGRSATFWRVPGKPEWSRQQGAATGDAAVLGLLKAMERLSASSYEQGGGEPAGAPLLELSLYRAGQEKPTEQVRLFEPPDAKAKGQIIAVSNTTVRPVRVSRALAEPLLKQARRLAQGG